AARRSASRIAVTSNHDADPRTRRSTRPGRLSSSQVLSVGRISSVTSSSTVRPPCGCSVWANAASTDSLTISPFKRPTSARQQQLRFASHLQLAMAPLRLVYVQRLGSLVGACLPAPSLVLAFPA